MLRYQLEIEESSVCKVCPRKEECKSAHLISKQKPTLSEFLKYFHGLINDPLTDEKYVSSAIVLIEDTSNLLKKISDEEILNFHKLKEIGQTEGPIPASSGSESSNEKRIPSKFIWRPRQSDIARKENYGNYH